MNLIWVVRAALLVLVSTPGLTQAQCQQRRIRKSWDAYTTTEKDTYKAALASSMRSGQYLKFVEIHNQAKDTEEAHGQCMFIYWHRLMLIVFENMLRGQGPEFVCVTIPVWDLIAASNRLLAGQCTSLGDCSPLLGDLGGSTNGRWESQLVYGNSVSGRCVSTYPFNNLCIPSSLPNARCSGCLMRGSWDTASVPGTTSFASVYNQLFSTQTIGGMSPQLEAACHNDIHASLEGCMVYRISPLEPVFYSLHAFLDLLQAIFFKCRVGTQRLTTAQKANCAAWTSCARLNGTAFRPNDVIVMHTGTSENPTAAHEDPKIGQFFKNVPTRFVELVDGRDVGLHSYAYEISGSLANMYTNCDNTSVSTPPTAGGPRMLKADDGWPLENGEDNTIRKISCDNVPKDVTSAFPSSNSLAAAGATALKAMPLQDSSTDIVVNVITLATESFEEKIVNNWYYKIIADMGGQCPEVMQDLERQACMFQEVCLGGVTKYSAGFQATWHVTESRCSKIVNAIKCGEQKITYEKWREEMESHFGCPKPVNCTQLTSQTGDFGGDV